jgi:glycine/D-amino acid oxidase-like deaminating enzyme
MTRRAPDPLGGVTPGGRRSWWLREALAAESPALRAAAPPPDRDEGLHVDVAILGGGYTGLWTAYQLTEVAPGIRIAIVEQDICGGGPSGRNGGFVTGWWDELPTLVEQHGEVEGVRVARAVDEAVDAIGAWCEAHDVDAWYRKAGYLQVSAAPAQDGGWADAVDLCRRLGVGEAYVPLSAAEVAGRVRSPVFRDGVLMPGAATIQPALLARGLRRVLLERGVRICEGTRAGSVPIDRPRGALRVAVAGPGSPSAIRADQVVFALNAWAAGRRAFRSRLVAWSSYIVLTEPLGDRLAELGWTRGEGLTDSRFTLHYARTTLDGRIALGGGGGRAGFGGRIGDSFTHDVGSARRAAAGLRRWFPALHDIRIDDAWGGPIDISSDHLPFFGTIGGGAAHFGHGYSGNGVAPSWLGGRILAGLVLGRHDEYTSLPLVGARPRRFPPEPFRSLGARVVREAIVRREQAEEDGRRPGLVVRELSLLPRRMGYHLGPSD